MMMMMMMAMMAMTMMLMMTMMSVHSTAAVNTAPASRSPDIIIIIVSHNTSAAEDDDDDDDDDDGDDEDDDYDDDVSYSTVAVNTAPATRSPGRLLKYRPGLSRCCNVTYHVFTIDNHNYFMIHNHHMVHYRQSQSFHD